MPIEQGKPRNRYVFDGRQRTRVNGIYLHSSLVYATNICTGETFEGSITIVVVAEENARLAVRTFILIYVSWCIIYKKQVASPYVRHGRVQMPFNQRALH